MIIWHGLWHESFPPGYYRISHNGIGFVVEERKYKTDKWDKNTIVESDEINMSEWYGIIYRYDKLELLP